ncbi:MAG: hypothetical protein GXP14_05630 [Gammaproteobacteria bacterium]|nr:hypothetical protein [Gammaproteobacteria bacterium]
MKRYITLILISFIQGCSTVAVHLAEGSQPTPYAGTKMALQKTKKSWSDYYFYGQVMFVVADVPFSFIADTVLFPVDYVRQRHVINESPKYMGLGKK